MPISPICRCSILIVIGLLSCAFPLQQFVSSLSGSIQASRSAASNSSSTSNSQELARSDAQKVTAGEPSILFIGNSHTSFENLPQRVAQLIKRAKPEQKPYVYTHSVATLKAAASDASCLSEIDTRAWDCVVLQAQEISMSGKYIYSNAEGIEIAKRATARGAKVFFFAEWGRQGVAGETERTEQIYQEMADASGASLIPVGQTWDRVLTAQPEMSLHAADGNHQSRLGAALTALVLAAFILDQDPNSFAGIADQSTTDSQWELFCEQSSTVWQAHQNSKTANDK